MRVCTQTYHFDDVIDTNDGLLFMRFVCSCACVAFWIPHGGRNHDNGRLPLFIAVLEIETHAEELGGVFEQAKTTV